MSSTAALFCGVAGTGGGGREGSGALLGPEETDRCVVAWPGCVVVVLWVDAVVVWSGWVAVGWVCGLGRVHRHRTASVVTFLVVVGVGGGLRWGPACCLRTAQWTRASLWSS